MRTLFVVVAMLCASVASADEAIRLEVTVNASREDVWKAWTTEEGIKSFFARGANIELKPDGMYEIFFDPTAPAGKRGADGNRVMLVQRPSALAFTWNAPEKFPFARDQHTHVMLRFIEVSPTQTRVVFTHDGFGEGPEWAEVRKYFQAAWGEFVLPGLVKKFKAD